MKVGNSREFPFPEIHKKFPRSLYTGRFKITNLGVSLFYIVFFSLKHTKVNQSTERLETTILGVYKLQLLMTTTPAI